FFKAEDGIRGRTVTGVQTCALPISRARLGHAVRAGEELGVVSPDGKLLACTYGMPEPCASLAILPVTGGAPIVRELNGRLYRWSPDGRSIVFVKAEGKKENLYQVPVAGGEPKAITNFPDGSIANFAWSPDGSRIVLTHSLETRDVVMLNAAR